MRLAKEIMLQSFITLMMAEDNKLTVEEAKKLFLEQYEGDKEISEIFISIINIARKEAIEECAKVARVNVIDTNYVSLFQQNPVNTQYQYPTNQLSNQTSCIVDKNSILNLINELK